MANLKEQDKWEDGVYQIEENDPVLGGENGVTNRPIKQLANRTFWLKKALELFGKKAAPKDLTASSVSTVQADGHTHKLPIGTTAEKGVVRLNSQLTNDSEQEAATPKAVKTAYDKAVEAKTAADTAQNTANDGVSKANAAQRTADDGVSKANAAQTSANAAQRTADDGVLKAKAAQTSANAAQRTANDGVSRANAAQASANNANDNANGRVSKSGDSLTGILHSVGIASKQYGMGAYSEQYASGAPYMVEETGSKDKDTYHPFVKGRVRSNNHYGTAFSFGYTTKQGNGDGFGRGIIHLIEDNGKTKFWGFEHDGEFRSAGDVKTSSGKSLETAVQPGDFQYQKKGNFEIRRYPDGTMIQSYFVDFTDVHGPSSGIGGTGQKQLTWAVSFVGKPLVWGNITSSLEDSHDVGVNILTKSTGTTLYWYNYEHSNPNQGACRLQFLAIGRWK